MHPLYADIAPPPLHERLIAPEVLFTVAGVLLVACVVTVVVLRLRRRKPVTRTAPPPGT